jgi:hypothetical protein
VAHHKHQKLACLSLQLASYTALSPCAYTYQDEKGQGLSTYMSNFRNVLVVGTETSFADCKIPVVCAPQFVQPQTFKNVLLSLSCSKTIILHIELKDK